MKCAIHIQSREWLQIGLWTLPQIPFTNKVKRTHAVISNTVTIFSPQVNPDEGVHSILEQGIPVQEKFGIVWEWSASKTVLRRTVNTFTRGVVYNTDYCLRWSMHFLQKQKGCGYNTTAHLYNWWRVQGLRERKLSRKMYGNSCSFRTDSSMTRLKHVRFHPSGLN